MNRIVEYLRNHSSVDHPIKGKDIASHFGISGIKVREEVNMARCAGVPICSSSSGYFYSNDKDQIRKTVDSMSGRISAQENAICGLQSLLI